MKTHADHIEIARSLVPRMTAAARSAELARQPDDGVMAHACELGLFDLLSPRIHGGDELDLDTFFEVALILAQGDASHAWVMSFYIEHVWMLCLFPAAFQEELFANRSFVLAPGMLSPSGKARTVDGGYELDGRWQWSTGIVHADWVIAGGLVEVAERLEPMFFALPKSEVVVEDTWNVDGMCATGSHDVVIEQRFVPPERAVSIRKMMNAVSPGSERHAGPLYATPMAPVLSLTAMLPVLGLAKTVVGEFATQLSLRYDMATLQLQASKSGRQSRLAEADLDVAAAEALARWVVADVMAKRGNADEATRVRWTASIAHVVATCRKAIDKVGEAAGSSSHFLTNPIQRARRDVNTMACHMAFDVDERMRCHGRALLGMPAESIWH